jgi:hypothetical protein
MTDKPPAPRRSVGYGMPPVETRFQAGQSGNRKGRPKGARNLITIINEELSQFVTATVNGKSRRLTTGQAIVKRVVNLATGGNLRAAEILLKHAPGNHVDQSAGSADGQTYPNEQDEALLKRHMARMTAAVSGRKDEDNE